MAGADDRAEEITLTGIVQGVGFRPFVYRLARRLALRGWVRNTGNRVVIRIIGPSERLDTFAGALRAEAPPLARITALTRTPAAAPEEEEFRIIESGAGTVSVGVVPDGATCPACLKEIADPTQRRFRYAFTNCTDCGPRFSIVTGLPYDRPATTMAGFALCPACRGEYEDPADRRFHAQPIACPACGPKLWLEMTARDLVIAPGSGSVGPTAPPPASDLSQPLPGSEQRGDGHGRSHSGHVAPAVGRFPPGNGDRLGSAGLASSLRPGTEGAPEGIDTESPPSMAREAQASPWALALDAGDDPLAAAAALLRDGGIIAVKGIGGFHIACDATNAATVAELRRRKHRPTKPLALMAGAATLASFCSFGAEEEAALDAPSAPIVLLPLKEGANLAPGIAPGQRHVGVMRPYTPLHHLLLEQVGRPLVMTSANRSGAPQVIDNEGARMALAGIADALLMHDRPIARRLDDSVTRLAAGKLRVMRRGRGLAPLPLTLPADFAEAPPVLALGGELKSAICLTHGAQALLSHHLGDLDEPDTTDAFEAAIADYTALFAHAPAVVVVDLHDGYHATRHGTALAHKRGLPLHRVQHHHAHMAAAMAEAGWRRADGPVAGVILDGLGLGDDGTLWGGEILIADYVHARRVGRLAPIPLAGGDAANREPWRVLLAHLDRALGRPKVESHPRLRNLFAGKPVGTLRAMMDKGLNAPMSSSAGRLFDAVAALLGLAPDRLSHEGEAAMALEAAATAGAAPYPFALRDAGGLVEIDPAPLWSALLADLDAGRPRAPMAAAFHAGLASAFADAAADAARREGLKAVALAGGVFQNALLLEAMVDRLAGHGLTALVPADIPANDGGLALGQAVVAAARRMGTSG